ncbi:DUF397 domain-containing protein [Solihabitans fulvus]|uniref:DUF397 domain-containing protein n=1 Tax=Solihabitans fulvus TaxID=1892852 RepID=A0A5B2WQ11_9PSEU|nr:DUF397 domain-containing protein [Solihabitans fulvus]KAA2253565.1 DUF397 domain-containing protein [Solihabitans fulvus]
MTAPDFSRALWRKSSRSSSNGGACVELGYLPEVGWRKSSRSGSNGGACVELAFVPDTDWRKSSRSGSNAGQCVELARLSTVVGIRDSKNATGPVLAFGQTALDGFLTATKGGHFDMS